MKKFPEIDLEKYKADFSGYKYSISFVGNPSLDSCLNVLCELAKVFKNRLHIFSTEKDFLKSIEKIKEQNLLEEDDLNVYSKCWQELPEDEKMLAKIYNASKINLSIHSKEKSAKNYQIFEILASGGFLLTDERTDLKKYFEVSKHLETYKNKVDLIDKIDFYLKNLNIAQKIATLGRVEIIKNNIFSTKAKKII